ncbi:hypothetical protein BJX66DRAFT_337144 [Aspergillus keveii]|uniref:Carboxylic ester hydrolase n=1 Tax=Aspergillus keveii TaxID=714993 RepID=A0ABR4G7Z7_9EURO
MQSSHTPNNRLKTAVEEPPPSQWDSLSLDTWMWEIASLAFSTLCFVTILAMLLAYNDKPWPKLPHGFTLNAIVSVLATGTKSSLIFITSTAIGQLKWIWYSQRHQLHDMQLFDDASRGPLGSLLILFRYKSWSLVSLGALITVLSLALDPFMQQLVSYPLREAPSASALASVQRCTTYEPGPQDDFGLRKATNAGIWTDNFEVEPMCESGNCTWPPFSSVGICSVCEDITPLAQIEGCVMSFNASLVNTIQTARCAISVSPGNSILIPFEAFPATALTIDKELRTDFFNLGIPKEVVWAHMPLQRAEGNTYPFEGVYNTSLQVISHATFSLPNGDSVDEHPERGLRIEKVTQCGLALCAREYKVAVANGQASINVTAVDYGDIVLSGADGEETCWVSTAQVDNKPAFEVCNVVNLAHGLGTTALEGRYYYDWLYSPSDTLEPGELNWRFNRIGLSNNDKSTIAHNLDSIMNTTLTRLLHNVAASLTQLGRDRANSTVRGTASVSQAYVRVNWVWISLPATVVVLTLVFLVLTLLANREQGAELWKSSILPVLYHGLDESVLWHGEQTGCC